MGAGVRRGRTENKGRMTWRAVFRVPCFVFRYLNRALRKTKRQSRPMAHSSRFTSHRSRPTEHGTRNMFPASRLTYHALSLTLITILVPTLAFPQANDDKLATFFMGRVKY